MHVLVSTVPTLALSMIYCLYQVYQRDCLRRQRRLRERVAWMLWSAAMEPDLCATEA
jgi:hypothetical protein